MNMKENYYMDWDDNYSIENQYNEWMNEMEDYDPEYAEAAEGIVIVDEKYAEEEVYYNEY